MKSGEGLREGVSAGCEERGGSPSGGVIWYDFAAMSVWSEIYTRFDPEVTEVDAAWRADRTHGPFRSIVERLDLQDDESKVLLTGTVGSGKSTELLRVAEARGDKEFVILLDLDRHFTHVVGDSSALRMVEAWEVCFLACVALVRAAREQLGFEVDKATLRDLETAWRQAATASQTPDPGEVDVIGLGKSMFITASEGIVAAGHAVNPVAAGVGRVALAALRALSDAAKWRLPMGRASAPLVDQDESIRTLLAVANRIIGEVQLKARRVLLVLDGLDRITDIDHARRLFLDSGLLGRLFCSVVLCAPFAMRHAMDLARVRRFHCVTLVNEPVLDPHRPLESGVGLAVMRDMYQRRVRDLGDAAALDASLLDRVAYYSGAARGTS